MCLTSALGFTGRGGTTHFKTVNSTNEGKLKRTHASQGHGSFTQ